LPAVAAEERIEAEPVAAVVSDILLMPAFLHQQFTQLL
jgi:3-deoxy-D-manno-octulosonic acid (KDO) 8-phosphate synthase